MLASSQPVLPHAGHDHGKCVVRENLSDRAEEDIDGWAAGIFRRCLKSTDVNGRLVAIEAHVEVAGSDPDKTGLEHGRRNGFPDKQGRAGGKALGEEAGKGWRHMLNDDDGYREIGWKFRDQFGEGVRASGGSSDRDDVNSLLGG